VVGGPSHPRIGITGVHTAAPSLRLRLPLTDGKTLLKGRPRWRTTRAKKGAQSVGFVGVVLIALAIAALGLALATVAHFATYPTADNQPSDPSQSIEEGPVQH
jgi:hypothetical protein